MAKRTSVWLSDSTEKAVEASGHSVPELIQLGLRTTESATYRKARGLLAEAARELLADMMDGKTEVNV